MVVYDAHAIFNAPLISLLGIYNSGICERLKTLVGKSDRQNIAQVLHVVAL